MKFSLFYFSIFHCVCVCVCACIMCAFLIFQSEKQICHNFILFLSVCVCYWIGAHLMRRCLHYTRFFTFFSVYAFSIPFFCILFFCGIPLLSVFGGGAQVVVSLCVWLMLINYMAAFKLKSATTTQTNLIEKLFSPRFAYKLVRHLVAPPGSHSVI